jgi:glyoxylase-like metal-dependent hydrolase (beta-lactamase superfamily II)
MNTDIFHFNIGMFECIAVSDGSLATSDPARLLFTNAPKEILEQVLRSHNIQLDKWVELFTCLVIKTGQHIVLVDTGLGIMDWAPHAGKLLQNLINEGINPNEIDTVIISHAHGDHVGGNTDSEGRPAFPRARYYIRKDEWDFWTSKTTLSNPIHEWMGEFVNKSLLPIKDRFHFIKQDLEIVPGIKTLFSPGHTPGNTAVVIESRGEQLLYLGDVILHPIHLEHPDWYSDPDCQPAATVRTRRLLLERAADDHALIFAYHFDFPGLGYAQAHQENWMWQPFGETR